MKIQSLGYILVETKDLSAWDNYGQEVCGFMKHPDFSDEEKLYLLKTAFKTSDSVTILRLIKGDNWET